LTGGNSAGSGQQLNKEKSSGAENPGITSDKITVATFVTLVMTNNRNEFGNPCTLEGSDGPIPSFIISFSVVEMDFTTIYIKNATPCAARTVQNPGIGGTKYSWCHLINNVLQGVNLGEKRLLDPN
jgi:hypothetical protein